MNSNDLWKQLMMLEVLPKPSCVIPMSEIGNGDSTGIYADQDNY